MSAPEPAVLAAFGCSAEPEPLAGGQGLSWRSGDVVLKPAEVNAQITEWICDLLATLDPGGYRISAPVRAVDGGWQVDGWTASVFEPGVPADETGHWAEVLRAGAAFGRDLVTAAEPWFTTMRTDRWAIGDRVAWQEESVDLPGDYADLVARLKDLAGDRPAEGPQVVHGDLTGNVLLQPGLDPLILDFSPYWRPAPYPLAVVMTDAMSWYGAEPFLLRQHADVLGEEPVNYLARSLIFRVVTAGLWAVEFGTPTGDLPDFVRVTDQLTAFADTG
jgi:uncharacterized protein (TIGR02569 family)